LLVRADAKLQMEAAMRFHPNKILEEFISASN
jgi:hypothetical protein